MMTIMHVDVNSAYLSWTAAALLEKGYGIDLRMIPSAIGGDPESRHGIILAKSIPAKKFGVKTGDTLYAARQKCPGLQIFPPDYDLFLLCSDAMDQILSTYTPLIQRYSVDESFLDCGRISEGFPSPVEMAREIKERIKGDLGFTVNIGVAENKVLAKMAGELKKPDMVHTLWADEIPFKLWPLPVGELFMVGRATAGKLQKINIKTVGDLARADVNLLKSLLKSHGQLIHQYANGIDPSPVTVNKEVVQKGIGNSMTMAFDAEDIQEILQETLALCERVGMRLRKLKRKASLVAVYMKSSTFSGFRHQVQLPGYIDTTSEIYTTAKSLIMESWKGQPLRKIGVSVSNFVSDGQEQISLFQWEDRGRQEKLEKTVDKIRSLYGDRSIIRGCFANSPIDPIQGGVNDGDYLMMGGFRQ